MPVEVAGRGSSLGLVVMALVVVVVAVGERGVVDVGTNGALSVPVAVLCKGELSKNIL